MSIIIIIITILQRKNPSHGWLNNLPGIMQQDSGEKYSSY